MTRKPASSKKQKQRGPFALEESLQLLTDTARDVLVDLLAINEDDATRVAREVIVRFAEAQTGEQIYIAKGMGYRLDVRDMEIYAQFNGRNHKELARRFNVAPRHVYRIVRRARAIDSAQHIDDLFPGREIPDRRR